MMSNNDDLYEDSENAEAEDQFFERADEFIAVANNFADSTHQVTHLTAEPGKVSASFMFANARYSVWNAACSYREASDFIKDRQVILDYYMEQFKSMLENNLDEYADNFETYFSKTEDDEDVKQSFS